VNTIITKIVKNKALFALIAVFGLSVLLAPASASAVNASENFGLRKLGAADQLGGTLGRQDLITTITKVIKIGLSLLGLIAVVIILAGGFKWMTAGGNEDKVGEAKKMIISGVIGLAIILSSFAIASFVIGSLSDATGVGAGGAYEPPGL
jgi:hypothetical protein